MFEVREAESLLGTSKLEFGDPPMGIAHGKFIPLEKSLNNLNEKTLRVFCRESLQEVKCSSVFIEIIEELQEMEITIVVESNEVYEKYFAHHSKTYEEQFG